MANVDGVVRYVIPKPLPLSDEKVPDSLPDRVAAFVRAQHHEGVERRARLLEWAEDGRRKILSRRG